MSSPNKKTTPKVAFSSEPAKWRHLVAPYVKGNVVELASGGDPVVPNCIQIELTEASYAKYNGGQPLRGPVQWRDDKAIFNLPFRDGTVGTIIASHLLEDFLDWEPLLREWVRVLRPGGRLVVCLPDKRRWNAAVAAGQTPNCAHKHEAYVGELSEYASRLGLSVVCDKLTECPPGDYNILFVGEKL
jgi:SAM-dependent methyltransferase